MKLFYDEIGLKCRKISPKMRKLDAFTVISFKIVIFSWISHWYDKVLIFYENAWKYDLAESILESLFLAWNFKFTAFSIISIIWKNICSNELSQKGI